MARRLSRDSEPPGEPLQDQVALLSDALDMQRQLFDDILREQKSHLQAVEERFARREQELGRELEALRGERDALRDERARLVEESARLMSEQKDAMARVTRAHLDTLCSLRRAYERRIEQTAT